MFRPRHLVRPSASSRLLTLLTLLALVAGAGGTVAAPSLAEAPAPVAASVRATPPITLAATPRTVGTRKQFGVSGEVRGGRDVRIERRQGARWVLVQRVPNTEGIDTYGTRLRAPTRVGSLTLRAVAPAQRSRGRQYPRHVSRPVTVRIERSRVSFELPGRAPVGSVVTATLRVTPAGEPRTAILQQQVGGRWEYVTLATVNRRGDAELEFRLLTRGPAFYRVVGEVRVGPRRISGTGSAPPMPTRRVSVRTEGTQVHTSSGSGSVSDDGRFVAFSSSAPNLTDTADNAASDVFVKDMRSGAVDLISGGLGGRAGAGASFVPSISGDGATVAFLSNATDLVARDTNGATDAFVWDRASDRITRVSVSTDGQQLPDGVEASPPTLSRDGRFVAFVTAAPVGPDDDNGVGDVVRLDRTTGTTVAVSALPDGTPGDDESAQPSISDDGQLVAFSTRASNLTAGSAPGAQRLRVVARWDAATRRSTLVSRTTLGEAADGDAGDPRISGDGAVVAFGSAAGNLPGSDGGRPQVYAHHVGSGVTTVVSRPIGPPSDRFAPRGNWLAAVNGDGSAVLLSSDAQLTEDDLDSRFDYRDAYLATLDPADPLTDVDLSLVSRRFDGVVSTRRSMAEDLTPDAGIVVFGSRDGDMVPGRTPTGPSFPPPFVTDLFLRDLTPVP